MAEWLRDGRRALAAAIVFATIVGAWLLRYEAVGNGMLHFNRITGAVCHVELSCWLANDIATPSRRRG